MDRGPEVNAWEPGTLRDLEKRSRANRVTLKGPRNVRGPQSIGWWFDTKRAQAWANLWWAFLIRAMEHLGGLDPRTDQIAILRWDSRVKRAYFRHAEACKRANLTTPRA